jgi:DNA-binding Lrp family transcriptional regulator
MSSPRSENVAPSASRNEAAVCRTSSSLSGTLASQDEEATILRSYILIQTDTGRATDVAGAIRGVSGVISTETVTGPYDVIVLVEAEDIDAVGQLVVTAIQPVEGIVRTLTCPVVNL